MQTVKIPYTSVLRERDQYRGGVAEPDSPESLAIARALAVRLGHQRAAERSGPRRRVVPVKTEGGE